MTLDKKYTRVIIFFLFEFKMGCKAAETTHNNASGPGTANGCMVRQWFKKLCKGDESLEDEECRGRPSEADNNQLRGSSKLILL